MLRVFWKGKSKRKISVTAISEKKLSGRGILCTVWIAHWNRQIWSCQHPGRLEETVQEGLRSFLPNSPRGVGKNSGVLLIAGPLCIETQDQGNEIHCNSYSSPRTKSPAHSPQPGAESSTNLAFTFRTSSLFYIDGQGYNYDLLLFYLQKQNVLTLWGIVQETTLLLQRFSSLILQFNRPLFFIEITQQWNVSTKIQLTVKKQKGNFI